MIKQAVKVNGKIKRYNKTPMITEKVACTKTAVTCRQSLYWIGIANWNTRTFRCIRHIRQICCFKLALREKCLNTGFFLVRIFPHSDWIRRNTSYLSVFSPNAGKYGPEKTPNLDTFHTVLMYKSDSSDSDSHCTKNEEILSGKLHFLCSVTWWLMTLNMSLYTRDTLCIHSLSRGGAGEVFLQKILDTEVCSVSVIIKYITFSIKFIVHNVSQGTFFFLLCFFCKSFYLFC